MKLMNELTKLKMQITKCNKKTYKNKYEDKLNGKKVVE